MILRVIALVLLSALPAAAQTICNQPLGMALRVVGVAANDTLNLRASPSASSAIVARIAPGEKGVTAVGRAWQAAGQCATTCMGEEGGLNDRGRSIAFGCKADGQIWYEVRRANGAQGWASARFLEPAGAAPKPPAPPAPAPQAEVRRQYVCGSSGLLELVVLRGGDLANVRIGRQTYLLVKRPPGPFRYHFGASDGALLRGSNTAVEWRWPDGRKANCVGL